MSIVIALVAQMILYMLLMLYDAYAGQMMAIILGGIFFVIWGLSHVVEWVQPSRVNKNYYQYMISGWLAPVLSLILFVALRGGIDW